MIAMVEIESLELPEEVVDCLTDDAFDREESVEERISKIVTAYYQDVV